MGSTRGKDARELADGYTVSVIYGERRLTDCMEAVIKLALAK